MICNVWGGMLCESWSVVVCIIELCVWYKLIFLRQVEKGYEKRGKKFIDKFKFNMFNVNGFFVFD